MNFLRKHPRLSGGLAILFGTPLLLFLAVTLYYQLLAFGYPLEAVENLRERTLVLDRHGESIGHVYGHGENRLVVNVDEVSPAFIDALLAREDSRFYRHSGVDYRGVIRAARRNYQEGRAVQGASTLTMQLARNSFDRTEKTLHRKMLEIAIARRIERRFSKDEILGHYMNRIYFGSGLYGIERAAQGYFMKPAAELTIAESALLAGIIRGPSRFSPFRNEEAALGQQRDTLARMVKTRSITAEQAEAAKSEPLQLRPPHLRRASPGYVIQEVYAQLGERLQEDQVFQGGLRIFTTIDADLQQVAQGALEEHLQTVEKKEGFRHAPMRIGDGDQQRETDYLQGALIALDNQTGGILAMVGGRDFDDSPFNRALHAERQVGSVFKTFVYAQGFSSGLMPGTLISDGALSIPDGSGAPWQPSNSDGSFGGPTPAADGLIRSRNTMSIRVGQEAGVDASRMLARQAGFATALPNSPVSFLGAFESTPIAVTSAYSIFPNFGERKEPHLISRIEDAEGNLLFESPERSYSVLSPGASMLTSDVLARVMKEGTGRSAASTYGFSSPSYGKTGTTNDYLDAWFVGFTDQITCGVWVGFDRPKTIMNRGYGSTLALPIWARFMKGAEEEEYAASPLQGPITRTAVSLCSECGKLATAKSIQPYTYPVPQDRIPSERCQGHSSRPTLARRFEENPVKRLGRLIFGRRKQ